MNDSDLKIKVFEDVILGKNENVNLLGINKNEIRLKTSMETTCNFDIMTI